MAACRKVAAQMTAETQLPDGRWASRPGVQGRRPLSEVTGGSSHLKPELWGVCHTARDSHSHADWLQPGRLLWGSRRGHSSMAASPGPCAQRRAGARQRCLASPRRAHKPAVPRGPRGSHQGALSNPTVWPTLWLQGPPLPENTGDISRSSSRRATPSRGHACPVATPGPALSLHP